MKVETGFVIPNFTLFHLKPVLYPLFFLILPMVFILSVANDALLEVGQCLINKIKAYKNE